MKQRPPLQDSFEDIEGIFRHAAKQAVKSAGDTVKAAASDAKQQLTGEYPQQVEQGQQSPPGSVTGGQLSDQEKNTKDKQQALLVQTRKNIQNINVQLVKIRQEREKKEQENRRAGEQEKRQEKLREEKKKEEPVWKQMLKGKKGTHEASQRVAG
jgi:hypothetical protein